MVPVNISTKQFLHLKPKVQLEERVKRLYEPEKRKVYFESVSSRNGKSYTLKSVLLPKHKFNEDPNRDAKEGVVGRELVG